MTEAARPQDPRPPQHGAAEVASQALRKLARGETVHRQLPGGGRLHLERLLPWLVVYRRPLPPEPGVEAPRDAGTARLARSEAAWLVAEPDDHAADLVARLAGGLARGGPFLVIEIWSARRTAVARPGCEKPRFRLVPEGDDPRLSAAVQELASSLAPLERATGERSVVEVVHGLPAAPPGRTPLVARGGNVVLLGLEVEPVYRERRDVIETSQDPPAHATFERLYPLVLEDLRLELSRALRQGAAVFLERSANAPVCPVPAAAAHVGGAERAARAGAEPEPARLGRLGRLGRLDHEGGELPRLPVRAWARRLGRARLDGETRAADARLARIDRSIDFLLLVTPTNTREAWESFAESGYETSPRLLYRPLPFDPAELKRELFETRVESIDDPVLGRLLREKLEEIDRKITMLHDRGTERFLPESLQVYGGAEPELVALAEEILDRVPSTVRTPGPRVDHHDFARRAEAELAWYRAKDERLTAQVEVRDDLPPSLMVSGDRLCIGVGMELPEGRVDALIQHEVGTHLITRFNGTRQPLALLSTGLAGYDVLQEGLAVTAEFLAGGLSPGRLRTLAARVVAVRCLVEGLSLPETFARLVERHGLAPDNAWTVAVRVYRSGGFTKDAVYLRGLVQLLDYLGAGGPLEPLLVGKLDLPHTAAIEELLERGVLKRAALLPRWLVREDDRARLVHLERGASPLDLVAA